MLLISQLLRCIILLLVLSCATRSENGTLVKTIMLFRHGLRAPIQAFHLDESFGEDDKFWPNGYGKLVQNGRQQMFHLGQRFYEKYGHLVEPLTSGDVSSKVQVVTTAVHRCHESALHLLAGLFSSSYDWNLSEAVEKQPIQILTNSPDRTGIIGNKDACPRYTELFRKFLPNTSRHDIQYIQKYIINHTTRTNVTNVVDLFLFVDNIKIKKFMNVQLPHWITANFYKKLDTFFVESYRYLAETKEMIRLIAGPLIEDIAVRIKEVVYAKPSNCKMYFYGGHEISILFLSKILGFHFEFVPYFGSSFVFEVHRVSSTDYRVKVLFSKDYSFDFVEVLILPQCEELCPVRKFLQIVETFFVKDWISECSLKLT